LIFITVVVTVAMLIGNIYVLAFYAHPEDRNQAWFPKIVVLLGLTLAFLSVLMLPLDRANRNACDQSKIVSACTFTLPMTELWCVRAALSLVLCNSCTRP
jgi:LMBR1 domain-containing protein 1